MITLEPFQAYHALEIELQPNQKDRYAFFTEDDYNKIYSNLSGCTARIDGKIIFIGGLIRIFPHRYTAWSLISWDAGKHLRKIIRRVKRYFNMYYRGCRIECTCDVRFIAAHRFAKMLGFKCEAPYLEMYEGDKRTSSLYGLIVGVS